MLYELTGVTVKKFVIIMVTPNGEVKVFDKRNKSNYIKLLVNTLKNSSNTILKEYALKELEKVLQKNSSANRVLHLKLNNWFMSRDMSITLMQLFTSVKRIALN